MPEISDLGIFRSVLEGIQLGVYIVDQQRKVLFWNEGAEKITGYLRQEMIGRSCRDILVSCSEPGCSRCETSCPLHSAIREGRPQHSDLFAWHKNGQRLLVRGYHMPVRDSGGVIVGAAATFQEHHPFNPHRNHDLTDVGNQTFLEFHLRASLARLVQSHVPFSVLCLQIDELDKFRAAHGPKAESEMVQLVVGSIQNSVRDTDFLGRWSDGRILIILSKCDPNAVDMVVGRVHAAANACGLQWWGDRLSVTVSIGKTTAEVGDTLEKIIERAENSLAEDARKAV